MTTELLKEIVIEQQQFLEMASTGVERTDLSNIEQYIDLPQAIIIAGIRRAGKSTLLSQIIDQLGDSGYYCNFEDERFIHFTTDDFNNLYEVFVELYGERKIFFFDEIQNIPGWERFVRRMYDHGYKFFITGSNASLLSRELGTKLTGRHLSYTLYPFSFVEYLAFQKQSFQKKELLETKKRARLKKYFLEYMNVGGMPEYVTFGNPSALREVYDNILYRDIAVRYGITETKSLRELALYLVSTVGTPFSYNQLKRMLNLGSMNTVKSYIEYLENSFLFFTLNQYEHSIKKHIFSPKKIYCIDAGFINTMSFGFSENKGRIFENIVFLELKRRNKEIFYYKTEGNKEVDFVSINNRKATELIQVSWSIDDEKTKTREIDSLIAAMDELKLDIGLLLTYDTSDTIQIGKKKIIVRPAYQWLLDV